MPLSRPLHCMIAIDTFHYRLRPLMIEPFAVKVIYVRCHAIANGLPLKGHPTRTYLSYHWRSVMGHRVTDADRYLR